MKSLILLATLASLAIGQEYGKGAYSKMTCWESEGNNDSAFYSQVNKKCKWVTLQNLKDAYVNWVQGAGRC